MTARFRDAPDRAVRHASVPLLLAAATTAVGLLSLGFSDLHPVQLFGVFSAVGVVIGSAAHFLLLPAAFAGADACRICASPSQDLRRGEFRVAPGSFSGPRTLGRFALGPRVVDRV